MKLLTRLFIKNYKDTKSPEVRASYGKLAGIVGIITNFILAAVKIGVGIFTFSGAIIADGVNNFSDSMSSIITIIGFKVSSKKADSDHPFGHERMEYISGLIIGFLVLMIGFSLGKDSLLGLVDIINKTAKPLNTNNFVVVISLLGLSILAKCWQASFYYRMGKAIDSETLKASYKDSLNDCITTFAVIISTITYERTHGAINIDSIAGIFVSVFIIITGFGVLKDTINPLLGEIPTDEEISKISSKLESYEGVLGIHDLVIHNYGPSRVYATVHCEVSREVDVMVSHDLMDNIERDFRNDLGIDLTIHMDPVEVNDEYTNMIKSEVQKIIYKIDHNLTFHDFRVVKGPTHTNILFDIVMPIDYKMTPGELRRTICKEVTNYEPTWFAVIQVDQFYNRINDGIKGEK